MPGSFIPYMDKYSQERRKYLTHPFAEYLAEFRPQCNMFLLSQGMPRAVKVVDAVGIFRRFER